MNRTNKILLLIGSPKGVTSTSAILGNYVLKKLKEKNFETKVLHIHSELKSEKAQHKFLDAVEKTDLILLTFPLYVDTIPAPVIRAFELIAENIWKNKQHRRQKLIAIANCGFPEAEQNRFAISICKQFSLETGIEWGGGLYLGMGGAVNEKFLNKSGGKNVKKALDLMAESIILGTEIPNEALKYMSTPIVSSKRLYIFMGNIAWKMQALKNKVYKKLDDRPFA